MADEETAAGEARRLMRRCDRATLATSLAGWPYASLVLAALDHDATPLLLLSDLAEHARNLAADPRASLLFDGTAGRDDPLTGPRVTVMGTAERVDDPRLLARFRARHPSAALYSGFADFHLYRLRLERAHLVAGFGRIRWIGDAALAGPAASGLAEAEAHLLADANSRDAAAIARRAGEISGREGESWRLTGIDPEGADLRCRGSIARLDFPSAAGDAAAAGSMLAALLRKGAAGG